MVIKPPDDPKFTIWVDGKPKSLRRGPASAEYVARIQSAAMPQCSAPLGSHLLAVEIWFAAHRRDRADVDNVAGPILDALKGVVYLDDRQVRSVMVTALPIQWTDEDRWKLDGVNEYSLAALLDKDPKFLILVFDGVRLKGSLGVPPPEGYVPEQYRHLPAHRPRGRDPREEAALERAEERAMDHERELLGLTHIADLPHDWKEKREDRPKGEKQER